ncbi:hypothetical protein F52700_12215 [Fusarium sp. NRRL 52700]|nr:hypothetical protein F52700_12215 [Fusarium sp. NRRL 52700]
MAEAAGLVVGVVSLATVFDSIIKVFDYIHFARRFGYDFENSLLILDNAKLRLSRWGKSVGLKEIESDTKTLVGTRLTDEDMPHAKRLLDAIHMELKNIETLQDKFQGTDEQKQRLEPRPLTQYLHQKMQAIANDRQNNLSTAKKASWAIYDREHFKQMITSISKKIKALEELFPSAKQAAQDLVNLEVYKFTEIIRELQNAVKGHDKILASALRTILEPSTETYNATIKGGLVGVGSGQKNNINQYYNQNSGQQNRKGSDQYDPNGSGLWDY